MLALPACVLGSIVGIVLYISAGCWDGSIRCAGNFPFRVVIAHALALPFIIVLNLNLHIGPKQETFLFPAICLAELIYYFVLIYGVIYLWRKIRSSGRWPGSAVK